MNKPYVITINAVSGGGKTSLGNLLQEALSDSALFCFDDFHETNIIPNDFHEWYQRGANALEIDCPGMGEAVMRAIEQGVYKYLVLDCPLSREHPRFSAIIDLAIFINTPLDVAMARRIIRDHTSPSQVPAGERLGRLRTEMIDYLERARPIYLLANEQKSTSDLVLNGLDNLEAIRDQILAKIAEDVINLNKRR